MNAYFIKKIEKLGWKKLAKFDLSFFLLKLANLAQTYLQLPLRQCWKVNIAENPFGVMGL